MPEKAEPSCCLPKHTISALNVCITENTEQTQKELHKRPSNCKRRPPDIFQRLIFLRLFRESSLRLQGVFPLKSLVTKFQMPRGQVQISSRKGYPLKSFRDCPYPISSSKVQQRGRISQARWEKCQEVRKMEQ